MATEGSNSVDRCTRQIVQASIGRGLLGASRGDAAETVAAAHDEVARGLHRVSLDHGSEAMVIGAQYALAAMEDGAIATTSDAVEFVEHLASSIRTTARSIATGPTFRAT